MRIGLIDVDGHNFPNLCLMKLSGWHKAQGDDVEWWREDAPDYDIVYMAKVFSDTYSPDKPTPTNAKKVVRGGRDTRSGWKMAKRFTTRNTILHFLQKSRASIQTTVSILNTQATVAH